MLWPASRSLRTPSGADWAMRPMMKKVAFTHCEARMSKTRLLLRGNGPSSKVSTTSWSPSGSVSAYCMVPMRGCCLGSTTRVREVPSAPGWPRQSAADAVCAVIASNPRHKAAHCSVRTPTNTLPNMKPPPALPLASDNCTDRYERRLNCLTSSPDLGSRDTIKIHPGGSRDKMDHAIMMVLQIAQESRQHGGGWRLRVVQQDDPLAGGSQPIGKQLQFVARRHRIPVAGPKVGTEHRDPARLQQVEGRRRRLEAGKTKERRARGGGRDTVKRHFIGGNAPVDFLSGLACRDLHQAAAQPGGVSHGVAGGGG